MFRILVFLFLILSDNDNFGELHYRKECQYDPQHKRGFLNKKDVLQLTPEGFEKTKSTLSPQIYYFILEISNNIGRMRCDDYLHLSTKHHHRLQ